MSKPAAGRWATPAAASSSFAAATPSPACPIAPITRGWPISRRANGGETGGRRSGESAKSLRGARALALFQAWWTPPDLLLAQPVCGWPGTDVALKRASRCRTKFVEFFRCRAIWAQLIDSRACGRERERRERLADQLFKIGPRSRPCG